jgi:hypothetical protein
MVRGVNRQIIEINDTGNKYFEKALLFVAPGRSNTAEEKLNLEAGEYILSLTTDNKSVESLRSRHRKKSFRNRIVLGGSAIAVLTGLVLLILNIL